MRIKILLTALSIFGLILAGQVLYVRSVSNQKQTEASPTPEATPTSTPQVKGTTQTLVPSPKPTVYDPIVDCGTEYQKEVEASVKVKKSVCDTWVECQVKGKVVLFPREECEQLKQRIAEAERQKEEWIRQQQAQIDAEAKRALEERLEWFREAEARCAAVLDPLVQDECYNLLEEALRKDLEFFQ